jgi:voltage-gated potassium channel
MRKKIYEIIELNQKGFSVSLLYDILMLITISASIFPLMFMEEKPAFHTIEWITVSIFIFDYLMRWLTADYRMGKGKWSFVLYPFTAWAIIALPSGVITASYMDELRERKIKRAEEEEKNAPESGE